MDLFWLIDNVRSQSSSFKDPRDVSFGGAITKATDGTGYMGD
jgi:hypothetical protein